jgi:hypothetical protein
MRASTLTGLSGKARISRRASPPGTDGTDKDGRRKDQSDQRHVSATAKNCITVGACEIGGPINA